MRRARPICKRLTERGAVRAGQGASGDRKTHSHILMHPPRPTIQCQDGTEERREPGHSSPGSGGFEFHQYTSVCLRKEIRQNTVPWKKRGHGPALAPRKHGLLSCHLFQHQGKAGLKRGGRGREGDRGGKDEAEPDKT